MAKKEPKTTEPKAKTCLYERLGVSKEADDAEIKKAYRKLALKLHPDKGGDREMFEEIQKAFETLKATYQSRAVSSFLEHASTAAAFVFALVTRFTAGAVGGRGVVKRARRAALDLRWTRQITAQCRWRALCAT